MIEDKQVLVRRTVISPIWISSIRDGIRERTQFWHRDLGGKGNIVALVESGDCKKEKFDPRGELALLEERRKRRECELGERESGYHKERRGHKL